jgi:hypothetical protein
MKKINQEIKKLMRVHLRYRLIITNEKIELKITPKNNNEDEINWIVDNDEQGKYDLFFSLRELSNEKGL